jgi:hypothetical protein
MEVPMTVLFRLAVPLALSLAFAAPVWAAETNVPPPQSQVTAAPAAPVTAQAPAKRGFYCNMVGAGSAPSDVHPVIRAPKHDKTKKQAAPQ